MPISINANQFALLCSPTGYNNVLTELCSFYARYDNIVLRLRIVIHPEQYFTLEDFERLLGIVDTKAQRALEARL